MSERITEQVPLLSIRDLTVAFRTQEGLREVLHGVSFDVMPGETVAIVGESGSGKSTTATAIVNLLPGTGQVTAGSITLEGRELTTLNRREIEAVRGRDIGFVPQDPMSTSTLSGASASRSRRRSVRTASPRGATPPKHAPSRCCSRRAWPTPRSVCTSSRTSSRVACVSAR